MTLLSAAIQTELLHNAVLITGAPRSGTTLLGKLIGSLARLEYQFEPPSLRMIASAYVAGELPLQLARQLLTVYLSEDMLLDSVHGRGVNLRPRDDSQIFFRMEWAELNERWQRIDNRADAISYAQELGLRLAVKMPNLLDSLTLMRETLPGMKAVFSVRDGADVVRSILRKGWVENNGLESNLWPYAANIDGVNVPYWVPEEYIKRWPSMNPASRACLMWCWYAERGLAERSASDVYEVRYETLLTDAWPVVEELAAHLGHEPTFHTQRWVESICIPSSRNDTNRRSFAADTDADILARFDEINAQWGY